MFHGPGQYSKDCKVLHGYSEKNIAQQIFKDKKSRSCGNKCGNTVKFESSSEESNVMTSHDEPIPKKKKVKRQSKKTKSDQDDADPLEDGRNYGLDRLNL